MKKNSLMVCLILFLAASSFGQGAGNYFYNQGISKQSDYLMRSNNAAYEYNQEYQQSDHRYLYSSVNDTSFSLSANVLMNVKADEYVIILGISQVGETIEQCHDLINSRIKTFIDEMQALGISQNDVYIDFISQFPIFEIEVEKKLFSKSYNEIPKGFELKKNIHLRYSDPAIVEKMLIIAAKNEIYDIVKVDYIINDMQAVYDSLRSKATDIINRKIKDYKKTGILQTCIYQTVSENISSTYPLEHYSSFTEFDSNTGHSKLSSKMGIPNIAPSLYYNKLSYNSYDMVINPKVIEPVVQFSIKLTIKYILKKQ